MGPGKDIYVTHVCDCQKSRCTVCVYDVRNCQETEAQSVCVCVWTCWSDSWSDKQMTVVTQHKKKPASKSSAYKHCALLVAGPFSTIPPPPPPPPPRWFAACLFANRKLVVMDFCTRAILKWCSETLDSWELLNLGCVVKYINNYIGVYVCACIYLYWCRLASLMHARARACVCVCVCAHACMCTWECQYSVSHRRTIFHSNINKLGTGGAGDGRHRVTHTYIHTHTRRARVYILSPSPHPPKRTAIWHRVGKPARRKNLQPGICDILWQSDNIPPRAYFENVIRCPRHLSQYFANLGALVLDKTLHLLDELLPLLCVIHQDIVTHLGSCFPSIWLLNTTDWKVKATNAIRKWNNPKPVYFEK